MEVHRLMMNIINLIKKKKNNINRQIAKITKKLDEIGKLEQKQRNGQRVRDAERVKIKRKEVETEVVSITSRKRGYDGNK